jgi:hypothetical protein
MGDIILAVRDTPVPAILVAGGILFLFVAVGGQFGASVDSNKVRRGYAAFIGILLLLGGMALYGAGYIGPWVKPTTVYDASPSPSGVAAILPSVTPSATLTPKLTAEPTPVLEPSSTATSVPVEPAPDKEGQDVRWWIIEGQGPGICIDGCDSCDEFIPWADLKGEVQRGLLPQLPNVPLGSTLAVADFQGRQDWIVQIIGPDGQEIGHIWFGPDPLNEWKCDGLVRLGNPSYPEVWGTFRRYSDGSYQKQ